MIETKPWPGHAELDRGIPGAARTVELSAQEVREALIAYICKNERFVGRVVLQTEFQAPPEPGDLTDITMRVTFWSTVPELK